MTSRYACLAVALAGCAARSHPSPTATPTLSAELAAARAANHPLIAEFGAVWCAPCKVFEHQVLPDEQVQAALHDVTFVEYDADTAAGADAMKQAGVTALPALVSFEPDGRVRTVINGFAPRVDVFLAFVTAAK